jgi:hypothetical protein
LNNKVLLVCYHFPPNTGIGGRKWSFLSKYLLKNNVDVHVLTKQPRSKKASLWQGMTQGVNLHFFKSNYPRVLEEYPKNLFEKFSYKFYLFLLKVFSKSNYHDRGVLLQKRLSHHITEIVERNNISNVIITGAPFSFLYYGSLIKSKNTKIHYIADIRDSWIKGNYFGFDGLHERIKEEERRRLRHVLTAADHVFGPYPIMVSEYAAMVENKHIGLLPHAVDLEYVKPRSANIDGICTLVNFGSQYAELDEIMKLIASKISECSFHIKFYTEDRKYENNFSHVSDVIQILQPIRYHEMFEMLSKADASILFVNKHIKDFLSTKYIECFAAKIPIVLIGEKGYVSDFIVSNRLGIFIEKNEVEDELLHISEKLKELDYNDKFDVTPFTFERQADEMIALLK